MARTDTLVNFVTDICNVVRNKTGKTDLIPLSDLDIEIESIQTGGDMPEHGFIVNEFDADGYPLSITTIGMENIPNYYFNNSNATTASAISRRLQTVILSEGTKKISSNVFEGTPISSISLPDGLTTISNSAFQNCRQITTLNLPESLTTIGAYAFANMRGLTAIAIPKNVTTIPAYLFFNTIYIETIDLPNTITSILSGAFQGCSRLQLTSLPTNLKTLQASAFQGCSNVTIKSIPDGVTSLEATRIFYNCTSITQISMRNVSKLYSLSTTSNCVFTGAINIKAFWIGSAIVNSGLSRYALTGPNDLKRIFIDLPRNTVESFTNYQYAFINDPSKTNIIVCNDDVGFLTKEEFDAIDWSTYIE